MTKNDHSETQKCHFSAFLAFFKILFSSLQHPSYNVQFQSPENFLNDFAAVLKGPPSRLDASFGELSHLSVIGEHNAEVTVARLKDVFLIVE